MKPKILLTLLIGLLGLLTACTQSTPTAAPPSTAPPTDAPATATAPPAPTNTTAPTATPAPRVLYQEDFTDPKEGWETYHQFDGDMAVENEAYRMVVKTAPALFWVTVPVEKQQDVIINVDVAKLGGPDDGVFGVVCRQKEDDDFAGYVFLITSKGEYGIARNHHFSQLDWLGEDGTMHTSDAIHRDLETNHLTASCIGNTLTLTVNGQRLMEVQDDQLPQAGLIGLFAGNPTEAAIDVLFDNLTIAVP